jgi:hypothetical protein
MSRASFSIVEVRRAVQAVESGGKSVTGVEFLGGDRFLVLTADKSAPPPSGEQSDDWVTHAGDTAVRSA